MVRVKNKLKEKIIIILWENLKVDHTMKEVAEELNIPLTTFYRYLKDNKLKK